jgi:NACalpha-BTF3-like transcription factor
MEARITSKSAEVIRDENTGMPAFDDNGNPIVKLNDKDEMKALKQFATQRNFGPRYAQSVARVRLLKQATGIRSLPISEPAAFPLKVVGYRDQLTAQQRIQQIATDAAPLYGRPDDMKPLSAEEMAETGIEENDVEVDIDRAAVEQAQAAEAEQVESGKPEGGQLGNVPRAEPPVRPATPEEVEQAQQEGLGFDDGLPEPR